jgi:hypothetical protein
MDAPFFEKPPLITSDAQNRSCILAARRDLFLTPGDDVKSQKIGI